MANVHMIVGTLVIVGFVITLILNIRTARAGREYSWQKMVSFGAATLLVLQYMLGFSLLGSGEDIPARHFIFALLAIIPVGAEHGFANTRADARQRGRYAAIAEVVTLALVLTAYIIGQSNA